MDRLKGKVALVTGASSGIGFATARLFLAQGARVAITGNDPDRLAKAQAELGDCLAIRADAGDLATIEPMLDEITATLGAPDILFLNAGVARYSSLETATEAAFDEMFALHVKGPFFTIQKAVPKMAAGGSIIITTSINNRLGMAMTHVYGATKAAARNLVRGLAGELGPRNIRVNAVSPGPIITDIGRTTGVSPEQGQVIADYAISKVPLGRFGQPHELAEAVLFLASDESSFVTGTEIVVDGGWSEVGI